MGGDLVEVILRSDSAIHHSQRNAPGTDHIIRHTTGDNTESDIGTPKGVPKVSVVSAASDPDRICSDSLNLGGPYV